MRQLVFNARFMERVKEQKKAAYCTAVSQGVKLALYLISVCLAGKTRETDGQILLPELYNVKGETIPQCDVYLLSLTLSTVISSSASAVVSSSSVLACCSWLSRAWRAACRLLIWDSRSCSERVSSVTWRLISSFCSSCSSPIYKGRQKGGHPGRVIHQREQTLTLHLVWLHLHSLCRSFLLHLE